MAPQPVLQPSASKKKRKIAVWGRFSPFNTRMVWKKKKTNNVARIRSDAIRRT